jgi:hypothetical protein
MCSSEEVATGLKTLADQLGIEANLVNCNGEWFCVLPGVLNYEAFDRFLQGGGGYVDASNRLAEKKLIKILHERRLSDALKKPSKITNAAVVHVFGKLSDIVVADGTDPLREAQHGYKEINPRGKGRAG